MKYKRAIVILSVFWVFLMGTVQAQSYSDIITKSYKLNSSVVVEVHNKYGKVHVNTWDKDSVRFEIDFRINTVNTDRLNKLKSTIDFDFTNTTYYIIAETQFQNRAKSVFGDLIDIAESMVSSDNQIIINYTVYVPTYTNLKIENKFGDVFIDDYSGNITLELGFGDLKANSLNGKTEIKLNSSDAVINHLNEATIHVAYSDMQINNGNEIDLDSRSSNIEMEQVQSLKIKSSRDKFYLNNMGEIRGDSYFSVFTIDDLKKGINMTQKYGETTIEDISKEFSYINLSSNFTDIDLTFERGSAFQVDLFHHADVVFTYPHTNAAFQEELINKDENEFMLYGTIGNKALAKSKVKVNAHKKCNFNIFIK